jgi:FMN phosphatase YigB (HAD superfamily)
MRKFFWLAFLALISCTLRAEIFESGSFSSLLFFADKDTLIVCDVDNTLIQPTTHMGSSQWRAYIRQKAQQAGFNKQETEVVLDRFWYFVQPFLSVEAVDSEAPAIINALQSKTAVIALTARDPDESEYTAKQLKSAGVDLTNPHFCDANLTSAPSEALFQQGVIYCGDNTKPDALDAFFKQFNYFPKRIVVIDDRSTQISELENYFKNCEFVGIRFSGADARVAEFNPKIADIQWAHLPKLLSDAEAYNEIR